MKDELPKQAIDAVLGVYERQFNEGSGDQRAAALFDAIKFCGDQREPIPHWANEAFHRFVNAWERLEAGSLDEALGVKKIPETTRRNQKRNNRIKSAVFREVLKMRQANKTIPWDELAKKYGVSKTKLQNLYYAEEKFYSACFGEGGFPKIE